MNGKSSCWIDKFIFYLFSTLRRMAKSKSGLVLDSTSLRLGVCQRHVRRHIDDRLQSEVSHLHLQGRRVVAIDSLIPLTNLTVLYLYDNELKRVDNLEKLCHLHSLYLQWNQIESIENIGQLVRLRKLYLSGNRIKIIDNLHNLRALQELYVDDQRVSEPLTFSETSCRGLTNLSCLDASNNRMTTLWPLHLLRSLETLDVRFNRLQRLEKEVMTSMSALRRIRTEGNPMRNEKLLLLFNK